MAPTQKPDEPLSCLARRLKCLRCASARCVMYDAGADAQQAGSATQSRVSYRALPKQAGGRKAGDHTMQGSRESSEQTRHTQQPAMLDALSRPLLLIALVTADAAPWGCSWRSGTA